MDVGPADFYHLIRPRFDEGRLGRGGQCLLKE
jgi:hypothetical protein